MTQTYKKFPYGSYIPNYANGLKISNNATTPLTKLDIAVGNITDSTGTFQLSLDTAVTINSANTGLNGIDTGSLAASKVYAVYLVSDPVGLQTSGCMLSLSLTAPVLPFGYGFFALIGFVTTDAAVHFLKGYWSDGNTTSRLFVYDAPIQCLSGNQTGYTGVDLSAFVPGVEGTPVVLFSNFTANAAADIESLQGYNSTGDAVTIIAPVAGATAHTTSQNMVLAQLNSGAPSIKYKVSAGSLVLDVCSYQFFL